MPWCPLVLFLQHLMTDAKPFSTAPISQKMTVTCQNLMGNGPVLTGKISSLPFTGFHAFWCCCIHLSFAKQLMGRRCLGYPVTWHCIVFCACTSRVKNLLVLPSCPNLACVWVSLCLLPKQPLVTTVREGFKWFYEGRGKLSV